MLSTMACEVSSQALATAASSCDKSTQLRIVATNRNVRGVDVSSWIRFIMMDIPLFCTLLLYISVQWFDYVHRSYIRPQAVAFHWTSERAVLEHTYYTRPCDAIDISTHNVSDLFVPTTTSPSNIQDDAAAIQMKHGFTFVENVLSSKTMYELRNHIHWKNRHDKNLFVIESDHRFNILLGTEEPSVRNALEEIANHEPFRRSLEAILGPNPAMVEMTAISSSAGAVAQYWHQDVNEEASAANYMQSFGSVMSVFIQLQNTTRAMGATSICPGSHYCTEGPIAAYCEAANIQAVNQYGYTGGDALIMNMNSFHRGSAHTDSNAPERIMLILSFTPKPSPRAERRQISQGFTYQLRWDMWGHTLNDLANANTVMLQPWATLRSLGLYKPCSADWGIDYIMQSTQRILHKDNGFSRRNLDEFIQEGGFTFLPSFLQADIAKDESWLEFLVQTLQLCIVFAKNVTLGSLLAYLLLAVVVSIMAQPGKQVYQLRHFFLRFVIIITIASTFQMAARYCVDQTNWAKDIVAHQRYTSVVPYDEAWAQKNQNDPLSFHQAWNRTTFPNRHDVLIETRYGSLDLGPFNNFIDGHPGNVAFNELLESYRDSNYNQYPLLFQNAMARYVTRLISWTRQNGRFLYQLPNGAWSKLIPAEAELYVKHQLWLNANPNIKKATQLIRYGLSGMRYGLYRDTALAKDHSRLFMKDLEQKIVQQTNFVDNVPTTGRTGGNPISKNLQFACRRQFPKANVMAFTEKRRHRIENTSPEPTEPFPGAWFEQGDVVEVLYEDYDDEYSALLWYGAEIRQITASGQYTVHFVNDESRIVSSEKIRRIRKFKSKEIFEIIRDNGDYYEYEFLQELDDSTIRAKDVLSGAIVGGISALQWRRTGGKIQTKPDVFFAAYELDVDEGDEVEVYYDDEHWYTGKITNVDTLNGEHSYNISFVDGTELVTTDANIRTASEYQSGETIEIYIDDSYYECEFLGKLPDGKNQARCIDYDEIVEGFTSLEICRKQ